MNKLFKYLWAKYGINPLDQMLRQTAKKAGKRVLICWNRGLGDIALGLYALTERIYTFIPDAEITFLTRPDLQQGFALLARGRVLTDPDWRRGSPFDLQASLEKAALKRDHFALILEKPDPTQWLMWQIGRLVPKLEWKEEWDPLASLFSIDPHKPCVGIHVQTETVYGYEKNWPIANSQQLLEKLTSEMGFQVLLFGVAPTPLFEIPGVIDLRGKTHLYELLSLIKNVCTYLVVPDSGVLSLTYYLNVDFPIKVISLWADPRQGILKQNVKSPNRKLVHVPLIAQAADLSNISVADVLKELYAKP